MCIEKFQKGSETLREGPFICGVEDGGVDINEIRPMEKYVEEEKNLVGVELFEIEERINEQRLRITDLIRSLKW